MIERTPWLNFATHAILFVGLFILVVPIYLVIVAASQTLPDVMAIPAKLLPGDQLLVNIRAAWEEAESVSYTHLRAHETDS